MTEPPRLLRRPVQIALLAVVSLLAMSTWFSASALVPQLTQAWNLDSGTRAWITMSVQIGFVVGAVASAVVNLPDRFPAERVVAVGALGAAVANGSIALWVDGPTAALILRFVTGACLALVYPPAMKLVASWCREQRGLCIGLLVGAITVGSGLPHLLSAVPLFADGGGLPPWRPVMLATSAQAALAAVLARATLRTGPHVSQATRFHWRNAAVGLRALAPRRANLGYFGHMWELYAMWAWFPVLLATSYVESGWSDQAARVAGFAVFAIGGVAAVLAGRWADRLGRTRVTAASLVLSGTCALLAGFAAASPGLLTAIGLVWGFTVIADSAQFSAAISELVDPAFVGTALTVQTSVGFLITIGSIRLVPELVAWNGWPLGFGILALGPVIGATAMLRLRRMPEAERMAMGRR